VNTLLAAGMGAVVACSSWRWRATSSAIRTMAGRFFTRPFYDPQLWNSKAVWRRLRLQCSATSDLTASRPVGRGRESSAEHSARDGTHLFRDRYSVGARGLRAQLLWPATEPFPNVDTAFTFAAGRAWKPLFAIVGFTCWWRFRIGHGLADRRRPPALRHGTQQGASAILLGVVDPRRHVPRNNVFFVGRSRWRGRCWCRCM